MTHALPLLLMAAQLLEAPTPGTPTLGEIEAMTPEAAGEVLLRSWEHRRIVAVQRKEEPFLPATSYLALIETPRSVPGGCLRRRWTAQFAGGPGVGVAGRGFAHVTVTQEVALPVGERCPENGYAHLQPGIDEHEALPLLRLLRRIATRRLRVAFTCRSEVDSGLCASDESIRAGLRATPPWAVSLSSGTAELWIGVPGQVVTIVRFPSDRPNRVSVVQRIPAPF